MLIYMLNVYLNCLLDLWSIKQNRKIAENFCTEMNARKCNYFSTNNRKLRNNAIA